MAALVKYIYESASFLYFALLLPLRISIEYEHMRIPSTLV